MATSILGGGLPLAAAATPGLSVSGNQLLRDGVPYLPRGFNAIGLLAPAWCTKGSGPAAAAHYGQAELDAAKAWNANTIRFQVSQRGLADTTIAAADRASYLSYVEAGVALARANGFTVILSLQDQSNGCGPAHPLPTAQSVAAWNVVAPAFMNDQNVMYELYNEPTITNSPAGWNEWATGGISPQSDQGDTAVGEQQLVDTVRATGATNVVVVQGLHGNSWLQGLTPLSDPTGQLMYSVHPYTFASSNPRTSWDVQFGNASATYPVIATEWNYLSTDCGTSAETLAPSFLQYLQAHHIGVLGHALDAIPTSGVYNLVADWSLTPTSCGSSAGGAGQVLKSDFAGQADAADLVTPAAPASLSALAVSDHEVDLSWPAAGDNVGVAGYRLSRGGVILGTTGSTSYADTAATPQTTATYTVTTLDAAGNTSAAISAAATTPADTTPPSAASNLVATPTASHVALAWTAATDDVGVSAYTIARDGVQIGQSASTSFDDITTAPGSTYSYAIAAVDAAGNAGPATTLEVTTPTAGQPVDVTPPSVPTNLAATTPSEAEVDLSWSASTDDTGVADYQVRRDGTIVATIPVTQYTDEPVAPGSHSYAITAVDAAGNVSAAATITVTVPDLTPPSQVTGLTAVQSGQTQVNLTWSAATDNVRVAAYQVRRGGIPLTTTTGTALADTTVVLAGSYSYTVVAVDAAGNAGAASSPATVSIGDVTPPSATTGLSATAAGPSQVNLTWSAASDNVGVAHYVVMRGGVVIATPTGLAYSDTGLTAGGTYAYTVRAVDAAGNLGPVSSAVQATTPVPDNPPTAPTGLAARLVSPTKVTLTWKAASDDHGVASYKVARDGHIVATVKTTTYNDTTMVAGSHSYVVSAVDTSGQSSPASAPATAVVPASAANGLTGAYYANATLSGKPVLTRVDSTINFAWGSASPGTGVPATNFSVNWSGELIPLSTETYTLTLASDDGARLWINGQQLINDWTSHALKSDKVTVALSANQPYTIQIQYYELKGTATAKLQWSTPTIATQVVPQSQLLAK